MGHQFKTDLLKTITFSGERYQVSLPWKPDHPPLLDNYELLLKRLHSLLKHLRHSLKLLAEKDLIIKDQLHRGIIEIVNQPSATEDQVLTPLCVVSRDKVTTKLRVILTLRQR